MKIRGIKLCAHGKEHVQQADSFYLDIGTSAHKLLIGRGAKILNLALYHGNFSSSARV